MVYFQFLATVVVIWLVIVAFALHKRFGLWPGEVGFGLDVDKMDVTCKVKCDGGTISKTCRFKRANLCAMELKDSCNEND
jgi:hypothetical protein